MTDEMMDNARLVDLLSYTNWKANAIFRPFLMGKAAAVVNERLSAREIVDEMVGGAVYAMSKANAQIVSKGKL